jgi:hypothetical protein
MTVLAAYASKHGATEGIAERLINDHGLHDRTSLLAGEPGRVSRLLTDPRDGAYGRGQPQRDGHDHRCDVPERRMPTSAPTMPAKSMSSHALTKKNGPAATTPK